MQFFYTLINHTLQFFADSVSLFSNIDEFKKKPETKSYSYYPETDEFYSSNMYAVRELPFALKVRGGGVVGQPYLSTQGMRKELILSAYSSSKFYLKILPPSSGIPYLIYSKSYNKPLVCGQYNNDPNNKLVFVWDSEDISSGSWDLIPSTYKGYFNIENQTYLGTADPNNPWSVFNYSIEVKSNGQVGYAKYNKQPQQEFLLEFQDKFKVKEIAFEPKAVYGGCQFRVYIASPYSSAFSINVIQTLRFAFIFRLSRRQHFAKVTPLLHRHGD